MNTESQKQFLIRFCYFALILVIAILLCRYGIPALMPFVIALLVSLLLKPLVRFLNEKCRIHKGIASVVTVLIFYSFLGLMTVLLSVKLFASAKTFVMQLPETYTTLIEPLLESVTAEIERFVARLDPSALSTFSALVDGVGASLKNSVLNFSGRALTLIGSYAISVPGWLLNFLIMIIATVFITMDYPILKEFLLRQLSEKQRRHAHDVRVHLGKTLGRYVRSYALILLITFCELTVGFLIIGVDGAVLIALLIALFDILPVVGSGAVLLPWAVIAAIGGNYHTAIGILILYAIITIVRNIIEPKIVGQHVGMHPIVTLLAMVAGTYVFGPIGLLGLPVALAIAVSMNEAGVIHLYRRSGVMPPEATPGESPREPDAETDPPESRDEDMRPSDRDGEAEPPTQSDEKE